MAADPQDTQKTLEKGASQFLTEQKIEKEIIKFVFGKLRSPLSIFAEDSSDKRVQRNSTRLARSTQVLETIQHRVDIQKISLETNESQELVSKVFKNLLLPEKIERIFELIAEVRLEKISEEKMSEVEYLQLFSYFLRDFILFYPYPDSVKKTKVGIPTSTASDASVISSEVAEPFAGIYVWLNTFQGEVERKITSLKSKKEELEERQEEKREKVSEEELEERQEGKQEKVSEEEQEKIIAAREKEMQEKEEALRAQISLEIFSSAFHDFNDYLNRNFSEKNPETYMQRILKRQVDFIKARLQTLEEGIVKKQPALKQSEKREVEVSLIEDKKEAEVLPVDKEELSKQLKAFFIETFHMSEENAAAEAQSVLDKAERGSLVSPTALLAPPPPVPSGSPALQKNFNASFVDALKAAVLRKPGTSQGEADKQVADFIASTGQIDEKAVLERRAALVKKQVLKIPAAIPYNQITGMEKNLEADKVLHVLPTLPEGEKLEQLDDGYILIGYENPKTARLYYLQKSKKEKLVECNPKSDLDSLCEHVTQSLEKGKQEAQLNLDRKQHKDLIISHGGGHNHTLAEDALRTPALVQRRPSLISQSSFASSSSSGVSQKKFNLEGYKIVLLKESENWPEDANIAEKTLYFKWNKPTLEVRHKRESGSVFRFERPITFPKNINLVANEFERYEKFEAVEGFEVAAEAREFLQSFAENPNPAISRRISLALPPQPLQSSQPSNARPLSPAKEDKPEGKEKEEIKANSNSPKKEERTPSPSKLSFHSPVPVASPVRTVDNEAEVRPQTPTKGMSGSSPR